ncbi:MAG: hypothetical protein GF349_03695 [Candidatus Magasanikbacteria bacterium]|nr:hypothetical protein [Candidatus Magasanikbacteria bacterium]
MLFELGINNFTQRIWISLVFFLILVIENFVLYFFVIRKGKKIKLGEMFDLGGLKRSRLFHTLLALDFITLIIIIGFFVTSFFIRPYINLVGIDAGSHMNTAHQPIKINFSVPVNINDFKNLFIT